MKKINTLTLNAYRHAVHILNPRHGRDKARHWGTLQTTERLPLARLAGEPRVRPDVCRHEHSPPFGAAEYRTVCKPAAVRPLSLLHLNALPHLPSSNFPTYFTFPWIAPSAPSSYTTHPTSTPCRGLWRRWERKRTAVEENSPCSSPPPHSQTGYAPTSYSACVGAATRCLCPSPPVGWFAHCWQSPQSLHLPSLGLPNRFAGLFQGLF